MPWRSQVQEVTGSNSIAATHQPPRAMSSPPRAGFLLCASVTQRSGLSLDAVARHLFGDTGMYTFRHRDIGVAASHIPL